MNDDIDGGVEPTTPIWAAFSDLMSVLLGAFVLILVGVIGVPLEMVEEQIGYGVIAVP